MKKILLCLIVIYRYSLGYFLGGQCRFMPSCSSYTEQAIKKYGAWRGGLMGIKRIVRCHPIKFLGGGSGYDPP
ncbi:MAG: membrane protein insertion efficiency factor YidD [Alphaproteobacteria bacterium]